MESMFKEVRDILVKTTVIQLEIKEENKKRDERFEKYVKENKRREERYEERFEKTEKSLKEIGKQIEGINNNQGNFAEEFSFLGFDDNLVVNDTKYEDVDEFFFHGFNDNLKIAGIKYDYSDQNKQRRIRSTNIEGKYDIVLFNTNEILVVDVEYNLKKYHVEKFCEEAMPKFKQLFPELKNYSIIGAFAALSFEKDVKELAEEKRNISFYTIR